MFDGFTFPPGVYVGTLNLTALIPGPSILTLNRNDANDVIIKASLLCI